MGQAGRPLKLPPSGELISSMLQRLLAEKREVILKRWLDLVLDAYPADTRNFLRSPKNQFTNPVGHTITQGLACLYDQLLGEHKPPVAVQAMDRLVRVRAVQDMTPSEAVGFIPALKPILREEFCELLKEDPHALRELEDRVDLLTLLAFDIYSHCKQRLYEIRVEEIRTRTERLLKMANLVFDWSGEQGQEPAPGG